MLLLCLNDIAEDGLPEEVDSRYKPIEMIIFKRIKHIERCYNVSGKHVR
jgi:hypothetical protein